VQREGDQHRVFTSPGRRGDGAVSTKRTLSGRAIESRELSRSRQARHRKTQGGTTWTGGLVGGGGVPFSRRLGKSPRGRTANRADLPDLISSTDGDGRSIGEALESGEECELAYPPYDEEETLGCALQKGVLGQLATPGGANPVSVPGIKHSKSVMQSELLLQTGRGEGSNTAAPASKKEKRLPASNYLRKGTGSRMKSSRKILSIGKSVLFVGVGIQGPVTANHRDDGTKKLR